LKKKSGHSAPEGDPTAQVKRRGAVVGPREKGRKKIVRKNGRRGKTQKTTRGATLSTPRVDRSLSALKAQGKTAASRCKKGPQKSWNREKKTRYGIFHCTAKTQIRPMMGGGGGGGQEGSTGQLRNMDDPKICALFKGGRKEGKTKKNRVQKKLERDCGVRDSLRETVGPTPFFLLQGGKKRCI